LYKIILNGISFLGYQNIRINKWLNFHSRTVHLDVIKVYYLPTDAQVNCLKNNIKIYIKTAPTSFGAVTPSSGSALFLLAKALASTNNGRLVIV
jgi:hypothetical protein